MRYSDDGEPSGTAGVPVLDILKREGLCDLIVVVTRYFGGTLLGTGGLVHAYSKSAKAGIDASGIKTMVLCRELSLKCDYGMLGKVQYEINDFNDAFCGEVLYEDSVCFRVFVEAEREDLFIKTIIDKTNASVGIEKLGVDYFEAV